MLIKSSAVLSKSRSNYNINKSTDSAKRTNNNKNLDIQEVITQNNQDIRITKSGFLTTPDVNDMLIEWGNLWVI